MAMAQDSTGPLAIKVFREMGVQKVWDPKKIHLVIDHSFPAPDEKVANLHILIREFVKQQGVRLVEGSISHQHLLENHVIPGMVLFGADSHTCQAGAIGAFATGIGSSEMAAVWASGKRCSRFTRDQKPTTKKNTKSIWELLSPRSGVRGTRAKCVVPANSGTIIWTRFSSAPPQTDDTRTCRSRARSSKDTK